MPNEISQAIAAAIQQQLASAEAAGLVAARQTTSFQLFAVQADLSPDQVSYTLLPLQWGLQGDLIGTTTLFDPVLHLTNVAVTTIGVQVGTLDARFTTDFNQHTATANLTLTLVNGMQLQYSGSVGAWATPAPVQPEAAAAAS